LYTCGHCGKEIREGERPDYSAVKGLVHHDCDVKYYRGLVSVDNADKANARLKWIDEFAKIVGVDNVKASLADRAYYFQDHSTDFIDVHHGREPDAVVVPHSEDEVAAAVRLAARLKIPITPRGAGTGFVGGAVSVKGGIILDLSEMNHIVNVDEENRNVTAEPGASILGIERELNKHGLTLGFDPGSGPVATIGGSVSTDQIGGDGWFSYFGSMRQRVRSLRIVIPNGSIVSTGRPLDRPTSAYNLNHLFIAAEGTLGVITQVTVKVLPIPEFREIHIVMFDGFKNAWRAIMEMDRIGLWLGIQHCVDVAKHEPGESISDGDSLGMLVLGFAGRKEVATAQRERALAICLANGGADAGQEAASDFWEQHHQAFPTNLPNNQVYGMESVTLPREKILPVYFEWRSTALKFGLTWQGGGFNLIPTQLWAMYSFENNEAGLRKKTAAMEEMLKFAAAAGATISAVHGVGFLKKKYAPLEFTDQNLISLMKTLKTSVDPNNIMNPGKIIFD